MCVWVGGSFRETHGFHFQGWVQYGEISVSGATLRGPLSPMPVTLSFAFLLYQFSPITYTVINCFISNITLHKLASLMRIINFCFDKIVVVLVLVVVVRVAAVVVVLLLLLIIIIIIIIYSFRIFHINVSWWSFTGVWVTASLLKSPGLFSVFW